MERIKTMKNQLINSAITQFEHLDKVNTNELGEVIDMIKDLEEVIYYATVTKAMKNKKTNFKDYLNELDSNLMELIDDLSEDEKSMLIEEIKKITEKVQ